MTGPGPPAKAPDGAPELARVESATLADLVEHALTDSDNTIAEALARMVAVKAGRQPTFADAGVAVLDRVDLLGVPTAGAHLSGVSGLGAGTRSPRGPRPSLLVLAASPQHPGCARSRPACRSRGVGHPARPLHHVPGAAGLGVVRAKTGTLTGVSSLSGTVLDADGRQLGFVDPRRRRLLDAWPRGRPSTTPPPRSPAAAAAERPWLAATGPCGRHVRWTHAC